MRSFATLVLVGLALLVLAVPSVVLADDRVALVIGNSTYAHIESLSNPGNDAADMTVALRRLGFGSGTPRNASSRFSANAA